MVFKRLRQQTIIRRTQRQAIDNLAIILDIEKLKYKPLLPAIRFNPEAETAYYRSDKNEIVINQPHPIFIYEEGAHFLIQFLREAIGKQPENLEFPNNSFQVANQEAMAFALTKLILPEREFTFANALTLDLVGELERLKESLEEMRQQQDSFLAEAIRSLGKNSSDPRSIINAFDKSNEIMAESYRFGQERGDRIKRHFELLKIKRSETYNLAKLLYHTIGRAVYDEDFGRRFDSLREVARNNDGNLLREFSRLTPQGFELYLKKPLTTDLFVLLEHGLGYELGRWIAEVQTRFGKEAFKETFYQLVSAKDNESMFAYLDVCRNLRKKGCFPPYHAFKS